MQWFSTQVGITERRYAADLAAVGFNRDRPVEEFSVAIEELSDYDAEVMLMRRKARARHLQWQRNRRAKALEEEEEQRYPWLKRWRAEHREEIHDGGTEKRSGADQLDER